MNKTDVLDYVMNTPHNTNRAVLSGMLDAISSEDTPESTTLDYDTLRVEYRVDADTPAVEPTDDSSHTVEANYISIEYVNENGVLTTERVHKGTYKTLSVVGKMVLARTLLKADLSVDISTSQCDFSLLDNSEFHVLVYDLGESSSVVFVNKENTENTDE